MKHLALLLLGLFALSSLLIAQPISSPTMYRPQVFDIQAYEVDMTLRSPPTKQVVGKCDIIVQWVEAVQAPSLPFHLRGLTVDSVASRGTHLEFSEQGLPASDTFHFRAQIARVVVKDQVDTVTVWYSGGMTTEGGRSAWGGVWYEGQALYALGVGFANNYVSATQHWMPCYDHPSDKARFRGTFRVPPSQTVASVGTLTSVEIPKDDSLKTYIWDETHPTATYLLTFAVGDYETVDLGEHRGIPHVAYSRERDVEDSEITYSLVPKMFELYSDLYGPYRFSKVGYVNTSRGAMEHQTMISMPVASVNRRDSLNGTAAHELAHQWFGDLVSPLDFRHAWLTESFATYSEAAWVEETQGWDIYLLSMKNGAGAYVNTIAKREGVFPMYDFPRQPPSSNYPVTIYRKGANVLAMARALAGDEAFYSALRAYLDKYAYGTAATQDMREALRPALGTMTDAFFDEWILGRGWPRLTVDFTKLHSSWRVRIRQVQEGQDATWPLFTTLPLNIVYNDALTGEMHDSLFVMTGETLDIEIASPEGFGLNEGSKCRSLIEVVSVTTVLEPHADPRGLSIRPNPAFDTATIFRDIAFENAGIEISDAAGRIVFSAIILESQHELDLDISTWPIGTYMVRVLSESTLSALPMLIYR